MRSYDEFLAFIAKSQDAHTQSTGLIDDDTASSYETKKPHTQRQAEIETVSHTYGNTTSTYDEREILAKRQDARTQSTGLTYDEEREKFFAYLTKRPVTRRQAEEYLSRHNITDPENLLTEAESTGLIDDAAYAKLFVDGHLSWGNLKITYELSSRGVSRHDIIAALDEAQDESDRASELADSWRSSGLDERKISGRLLSRGFSRGAVRSVIE